MLVKYLSDECWGQGIKSPSGSNVIDGIGVANLSKKYGIGKSKSLSFVKVCKLADSDLTLTFLTLTWRAPDVHLTYTWNGPEPDNSPSPRSWTIEKQELLEIVLGEAMDDN